MADVNKIIAKMRNQPHGIRMAEADKVLRKFGYVLGRQRGSHCHYINANGDVITIQEKTPAISACYVKDILERIERENGRYN